MFQGRQTIDSFPGCCKIIWTSHKVVRVLVCLFLQSHNKVIFLCRATDQILLFETSCWKDYSCYRCSVCHKKSVILHTSTTMWLWYYVKWRHVTTSGVRHESWKFCENSILITRYRNVPRGVMSWCSPLARFQPDWRGILTCCCGNIFSTNSSETIISSKTLIADRRCSFYEWALEAE